MALAAALESLWRDVKHGTRQLRRQPAFTAAAAVSLALAIGANTAIFTLVDQIVLRLLPVHDPRALVQLKLEGGRTGSQSGDGLHTFSHPLYLAFRERNTVFTGLTGQRVETASLIGEDRSEVVRVGLAAGNFFEVFGVRPHLGRMLTAEDDRARLAHPVAVLQYDFWRNKYSADRSIAGKTIRLNGTVFTVIGVSAPGFEGTDVGLPTNLWVPVMMKPAITPTWDALDDERNAWFYLFGRLKPGVTREQAEASLRVLYRQRQEEELKLPYFQKFPETKERFLRGVFSLVPASGGQSYLRYRFETPLLVLQGLVVLVLLIACTNVASLLLARAAARQKEVALRRALGAARGALVRQFLVEGVLLAAMGGAGGLLVSVWAARALVRFLPFDPAFLSISATPDLRVLAFTAAATLATALLFGLAPAWRGSSAAPAGVLKEDAGSIAGGRAHVRLRKALVGLQITLSCLLLAGSAIFARSLANLRSVDLGFDTENVAMLGVRPSLVYSTERKLQVFRKLIEDLAGTPPVVSVGANTARLLTGGRWDSPVTIPGVQGKDGPPWSFYNAVTPGYFQTLGIPVKAGRDVTWDDWYNSRPLCLVNERMAAEYFGGAAVGRMIGRGSKADPDTEIIGVFGDAHYHEVRGEIPRQLFLNLPAHIRNTSGLTVYVRFQGDPRQVLPALGAQVRRTDPNLVVNDLRMMDEQLNQRLSTERLLSFLSAGFAVLATLLSAVGLYGVLAFVVARRTREIGIRMALGAERSAVVRLVAGEMSAVVALGLALGLAAALGGGRYVESQLFGVKAWDPLALGAAAGVLALTAALAALAPAWRASRIEPMRALRHE
jgi:predicted permease